MDNNDLTTDLTSNFRDFFANDDSDKKPHVLGRAGIGLLHLIVIALLIYSGYHGIHATARYREAQGLGNAAGIVGILIIELVMLGIYTAYFFRRITGDLQKYIALAVFSIGVLLSTLGIVGDSLIQAGVAPPSWLDTYLTFGLPIAPVIMAIGAALVTITEPSVMRKIKAAFKREESAEKSHDVRMKAEDGKRALATKAANLQLNAMSTTMDLVHAVYRTPQVQQAMMQTAIDNIPELMRMAGIRIPHGTIIEGQVINPPSIPSPQADPAPAADQPADRPGLRQRIRDRLAGHDAAEPSQPTQPVDPPPTTDDAARHTLGDLTPAELRQLMADLAALRQAQAATPTGAGGNNGTHPNA